MCGGIAITAPGWDAVWLRVVVGVVVVGAGLWVVCVWFNPRKGSGVKLPTC